MRSSPRAAYESFVRSGKPLAMHDAADDEQWSLYQRGMRSLASLSADEIARRTPLPEETLVDLRGWQRAAGLTLRRPIRLRTLPGAVMQAATRA